MAAWASSSKPSDTKLNRIVAIKVTGPPPVAECGCYQAFSAGGPGGCGGKSSNGS